MYFLLYCIMYVSVLYSILPFCLVLGDDFTFYFFFSVGFPFLMPLLASSITAWTDIGVDPNVTCSIRTVFNIPSCSMVIGALQNPNGSE